MNADLSQHAPNKKKSVLISTFAPISWQTGSTTDGGYCGFLAARGTLARQISGLKDARKSGTGTCATCMSLHVVYYGVVNLFK